MKQINIKKSIIFNCFNISNIVKSSFDFYCKKEKKIFDSMKVFIIRYYEKRFKSGIKVNSLVLPTRQFYEK